MYHCTSSNPFFCLMEILASLLFVTPAFFGVFLTGSLLSMFILNLFIYDFSKFSLLFKNIKLGFFNINLKFIFLFNIFIALILPITFITCMSYLPNGIIINSSMYYIFAGLTYALFALIISSLVLIVLKKIFSLNLSRLIVFHALLSVLISAGVFSLLLLFLQGYFVFATPFLLWPIPAIIEFERRFIK